MIRVQDAETVSPNAAASKDWKTWLALGLFALLWADLIRELGYHWGADEQYAYGWFVPILALGLFWKRWRIRPEPASCAVGQSQPGWLFGLVVFLALLLAPVRIVYEINPDWPLPQWLMASLVVALSLYAVFLTGGLSWVKHFAFPICFIFIAVQWPYRIEHGLTQGLMRLVANLTVELLGWFDIPAVQHGNLIEVNTGMVGVQEACSGIRSFQSTLMAGLFLGELYLLAWPRRFLLVFIGVIVSFALNICRTLFLTWKASSDGIDAIEKWHDTAGISIFFTSFICLWLLAMALKKSNRKQPIEPAPMSPASFVTSRWLLASIGCWSVLVFGANELWYRSHESKDLGAFYWSASYPTNNPSFQTLELAPRTKELIHSDLYSTGSWTHDGLQWTVYFFRWNPTSIENVLRARIHRPERCLPASGLIQVSDNGVEKIAVGPLQLPFRKSIYQAGGKTLYVFYCQWEDGSEKQGGAWNSKLSDRLRSVIVGRRTLGQQTMEVILSGPADLTEATQALRNDLPGLVTIEKSVDDLKSERRNSHGS